jgi:hypothetical protein
MENNLRTANISREEYLELVVATSFGGIHLPFASFA